MQLAMGGEAGVEEADVNHKSLIIANFGSIDRLCKSPSGYLLPETDVICLWKSDVISDAIVFQ